MKWIHASLVAPRALRPRIVGHDHAYLAAMLATCFRGASVDPLAGQLHEHALAAQEHLALGLAPERQAELIEIARATQARARALPLADRPAVVAEVVRRLLDDAPSSCLALDLCVREAVTKRYAPSPEHVATAAAIVAAVTL